MAELPNIIEKNGGDLLNVFLLGFSQGSAMSYSLIGRQDFEKVGITIKGVAALSGYIPADVIPYIEKKDLSHIPFFLSHGQVAILGALAGPRATYAVIGGTGRFAGSRGEVKMHLLSEHRTAWVLRLLD